MTFEKLEEDLNIYLHRTSMTIQTQAGESLIHDFLETIIECVDDSLERYDRPTTFISSVFVDDILDESRNDLINMLIHAYYEIEDFDLDNFIIFYNDFKSRALELSEIS